MQLNLDLKVRKEPIKSINKNAFESFIELIDATAGYFRFSSEPTANTFSCFKKDVLSLTGDLIPQSDQKRLEKHLEKISPLQKDYIEDYFEDPTPEYLQIQLKYLKKCKASKKQQGAFYTPHDVIQNVLSSSQKIWNLTDAKLEKQTVLDPTMGAADWLLNWFNRFLQAKKNVSLSAKRIFFKNNIHGVDLDPVAVFTSRLLFWHQFDYEQNIISCLRSNLILGDAIDPLRGHSHFNGKTFDIIIGNPPYVVQNMKNLNCYTNSTNNLYSVITESATNMLKPGGKLCFVIPLSFVCSKKIYDLREFFTAEYKEINYSNYAIRPMKMFEGVDQRISIVIASKKNNSKEQCKVYSTGGYFRWRSRDDLNALLLNLKDRVDVDLDKLVYHGLWPKLADKVEASILNKLNKNSSQTGTLLDLVSNSSTDYPVYYYGNGRYFIKAINYKPFYKNSTDPSKENSELKVIYTDSEQSQKIILSVLNSKLYYWLWTLYSDCFHVDYKLLGLISQNFAFNKILKDADSLMKSFKLNSIKKKHGDNTITEFNIRASYGTVKKIDKKIFTVLGLNKSETKYLDEYGENVRGIIKSEEAA